MIQKSLYLDCLKFFKGNWMTTSLNIITLVQLSIRQGEERGCFQPRNNGTQMKLALVNGHQQAQWWISPNGHSTEAQGAYTLLQALFQSLGINTQSWPSRSLHSTWRREEINTCQVMIRRRQWQPTPVLLPGNSLGRGSLVGCRLWGRTESATTEAT